MGSTGRINPQDAHQIALALIRMANEADQRGERSFFDEDRRNRLAKDLRDLANRLASGGQNGRTTYQIAGSVVLSRCGEEH